ncbi:Protease inhibitor hpi [Thalictrum thalictroides]|uniref:Protease inhibitor hpi n=1 Tax=Thalictrum thalictroides TaxID=46969 RepID=A0A7J6W905_THATH|nr:Protease inhibitor hpi [Thalictrum thalictroides]
MASTCSDMGKEMWPELLGVHGEVAAAKIRRENRNIVVAIIQEGMYVTMDFRCDRVRIWVDKRGIVKQVPRLG